MKKIITLSIIIFCSITISRAQQLSEGNSMINVGLGFSSYYSTGSFYSTVIPPIEGSYELMIKDNISVGGFLGMYKTEYDYNSFFGGNYDSSFTYIHFGGIGNFHFVNNDKFNAYIGARLGYVSVSLNDEFLDEFDYDLDYTNSGILYGIQLGGRYFVSEKFAINAEIGYGISAVKLGATFKL